MGNIEKYMLGSKDLMITDSFSKADSVLNNRGYKHIQASISGAADSDILLDLCEKTARKQHIRYTWFDTGTFDSLIAYSGQSFVNFNYFFCNYQLRSVHFDRIFPLTNYFIIHPGCNLGDYRDMIWSDSGLNIGVFFTFLGDLLIDLGNLGMWIYTIIFFCISNYVCRTANQDGTIRLSRLLIILILILIPLQGVFYYSYYKTNIGYFVVGTLIISWILSHTLKNQYES